MASNSGTITSFLTFFTPPTGSVPNALYGAVGAQGTANTLMNLFCTDSGADPTEIPQLAVTEHGMAIGPSFEGGKAIAKVFKRLFSTFQSFAITPIASPSVFLISADLNTIALQVTLTGTHTDWWFASADSKFHSLPLSGIVPAGNKNLSIATCLVFNFNGSFQIQQLAVYMDRYHFVAQLGSIIPNA
jgi:hypothetical protein